MTNERRSPHLYSRAFGLVLVVTFVVAGVAGASRHENATAESPREKVSCPGDHDSVGDVDHHRSPKAPQPVGLLHVGLGVGVNSVAVLRLDLFGRIIAAATNSGCPPRSTDDVYVVWAGATKLMTDINISRVRWKGDFSDAGRFYPQEKLRWCPLSRHC